MNYRRLKLEDQLKKFGYNFCEKCGITQEEYETLHSEVSEINKKLIVHHKNGDHSDDRLENLEVNCRSCHAKSHLELGNHTFCFNSRNAKTQLERGVHPSQQEDVRKVLSERTKEHVMKGTHNSMQPGWITKASSHLRSCRSRISRRLNRGMDIPEKWYAEVEYWSLKKDIERGLAKLIV